MLDKLEVSGVLFIKLSELSKCAAPEIKLSTATYSRNPLLPNTTDTSFQCIFFHNFLIFNWRSCLKNILCANFFCQLNLCKETVRKSFTVPPI